MRPSTAADRRRLYEQASALVAREYRRGLTLRALADALASSPRQLQRAYAEFGASTFREQLTDARLRAAAELLAGQPSLAIAQVAQLVGYRHAPHLTRLFRRRYGRTPGAFRTWARQGAGELAATRAAAPAPALGLTSSGARWAERR